MSNSNCVYVIYVVIFVADLILCNLSLFFVVQLHLCMHEKC